MAPGLYASLRPTSHGQGVGHYPLLRVHRIMHLEDASGNLKSCSCIPSLDWKQPPAAKLLGNQRCRSCSRASENSQP